MMNESDYDGEEDDDNNNALNLAGSSSSATMEDDDVDIVVDDDDDGKAIGRSAAALLGEQEIVQSAETPKLMSERGRRFLIDCLLNLPKEDPSSLSLFNHQPMRNENGGSSSYSAAVTSSSGSSQQTGLVSPSMGPQQTPPSSSSSASHFPWNGLSKPAEIRKVYSANTTWPLWIYYTRYTHRPQQQHMAAQQSMSTPQIGSHRHPQSRNVGKSMSASSNPTTTSPPSSAFSSSRYHHHKLASNLSVEVNSSESSSPKSPSHHGQSSRHRSNSPHSSSSRRVRLAFTAEQLKRLKEEFECNHYLNEPRRKAIALELNLKEAQVKVWFQNKRAQLRRICNASSFFFLQSTPQQPPNVM